MQRSSPSDCPLGVWVDIAGNNAPSPRFPEPADAFQLLDKWPDRGCAGVSFRSHSVRRCTKFKEHLHPLLKKRCRRVVNAGEVVKQLIRRVAICGILQQRLPETTCGFLLSPVAFRQPPASEPESCIADEA